MKNEKSSLTISIIALIISIIALLINLLLFFNCPCKAHMENGDSDQPQQTVKAEEPQQQQPKPQVQEEPAQNFVMPEDQPVKKKAATAPFVDLGLPSGTRWRVVNEECGLITYDEAVSKFGKQLPSYKQYTELYEKCKWQELKNGGYKVTGPNGQSITFPTTGFINCTGEFRGADEFGDYWTSTTNGTDEAYRMVFNSKGVKIVLHTRCYARAIRLVEK